VASSPAGSFNNHRATTLATIKDGRRLHFSFRKRVRLFIDAMAH
jgi:hypothetical protein